MAAAIALLAAACTSGDDGASPRSPSTTRATVTTAASGPSSTPTTGGGAAPDAACAGLGPVPAGGTVTWVADGRLQSSQGCLAAVPAGAAALTWGGAGDRVLVGDTLLQGGGGTAQPLPGAGVALSRPTGTAVIQVTAEGRLLKRDVAGGDVRDISFLARHEAAVYHPAGRNIVSAGTGEGGDTRLVIADNEGRNAVLLVQPDNGTRISNLAFTASGALL
ncbi:MAG TPA: hypothetical protein VFO65_05885, partial [Acidimicrobiales bacterium]|nr:hypothetical protein [Acidimicrobiales bacterium]